MSKQQKTAYTVEQTYEDMMKGIEIGIDDLTKRLNNDLQYLGKNEMERCLSSVINYPDAVEVYSKKEEKFIKNLVALHGLHLQSEIQSLAELQQEHDNKSEDKGETNVG